MKFRVWNKIDKRYEPWKQYLLNTEGKLFYNDPLFGFIEMDDNHYKIEYASTYTDRDNTLLYEGDIYDTSNDGADGCDTWHFGENEPMVIEWDGEMFFNTPDPDCEPSIFTRKYIKIIGNINENPELLEVNNV